MGQCGLKGGSRILLVREREGGGESRGQGVVYRNGTAREGTATAERTLVARFDDVLEFQRWA